MACGAAAGAWHSTPRAPVRVYADIDLDRFGQECHQFDADGHYARPDVFTLKVNIRAQELGFRPWRLAPPAAVAAST